MPGTLVGSESIGGVSVSVSYDVSQLGIAKVQSTVTDHAKQLGAAFATAFNTAVAAGMKAIAGPTMTGGAGGGGGTATFSGGMNAVAAPYMGSSMVANPAAKAALTQMIAASHTMASAWTQTANTVTQQARAVVAGTTAAVGGGAGGGNRGALSPYMNPFSTRGLARALGSGMAVYGGMEILQVASALAEGHGIAAHPERILRTYQDQGSATSAANDPFLRGKAARSADIGGELKMLEGLESVPLLGNAIKFADAMADVSGSLKEEQSAIERAVAAHNEASKYLEEAPMRGAARTGNKVVEAAASGQHTVDLAYRRMIENPHDTAAAAAYHQAVDEARTGVRDAMHSQAAGTLNSERKATSIAFQQRAFDSQRGQDKIDAYVDERKSGRRELIEGYDVQLSKLKDLRDKATNDNDYHNIDSAARGVTKERDAKLRVYDAESYKGRTGLMKDVGRQEKEEGADLNMIRANAAAIRLRTEKDTLGAELKMIEAAGQAKLARIEINDKNLDKRTAVRDETNAQKDAARMEHFRAKEHAAADLDIRRASAAYMTEQMPTAAHAVAAAQKLVEEIRQAPPELKRLTAQTTISELKAMRKELMPQGGVDAFVGNGSLIPISSMSDLHARDRTAALREIDEASRKAKSLYGEAGDDKSVPKNIAEMVKLLNDLVTKFAPFAILS